MKFPIFISILDWFVNILLLEILNNLKQVWIFHVGTTTMEVSIAFVL